MNAKRKEILDLIGEKAYANERDYHGRSQSALAALQDVFGVRNQAVFRAASGLGGGYRPDRSNVLRGPGRWAAEIVLDNLEDFGFTDKIHLE